MDPGAGRHRTNAMCHYGYVFRRMAVILTDVTHEGVHVPYYTAEAFRIAAIPRRAAVPPCIPREDRELLHLQQVHHFLKTSGVFVTTVKQDNRTPRRCGGP